MSMEGGRDNRRRSMCRSYTYISKNTTEDKCLWIYGILKREKQSNDIREVE